MTLSADMPLLSRIRRLAQTLSIRWLDPLFATRHPGVVPRGLIRVLGPAIRQLQPNDRWNLGAFVAEWTALLRQAPWQPLPPRKRIFMFCCYRGQFTIDLVIAILQAWRGHQVTFGYLPKLQSPIKDPLDDHSEAGNYLAAVLGAVTRLTQGRVNCIDLSQESVPVGTNFDERYLAAQVRADIIMRVRREHFDRDEPEVLAISERYGNLGRTTQRLAEGWFGRHAGEFDLCLLANGASFESGYFCQAARHHGVPVTTYEKFAFSLVRVINHGDAFFHFSDLDLIWARRGELGFLAGPARAYAIGKAWELLDQRRTSSGKAWGWQYQKNRSKYSRSELEAKLGVGESGFALICPNVPFDAGYDGWLELFPTMREWLVHTVEALLLQDDLRIVIRAHPAEVRPGYGRERISVLLDEAGISDDRIVVLPGDSDVNTYDLMPLCRFALVFASTTGMEIAMHGKPVLAGASVYYARCGISLPVADRAAYFARLRSLAAGEIQNDAASADDAALLYFMFHYFLQWPFPYDKPSQVVATPPRRLPLDPLIATYVRTLDLLAMSKADFEAALPRIADLHQLADYWGWAPPPARAA